MAHSLTHASATATNVPVAARLPFLALGIVCLLTGLAGGLGRLGIALPSLRPGLVAFHGPLMVAGFLGTLVSLERAVALGRPWAFAAPLAAGAGALGLAFAPGPLPALVLTLAGVVLLANLLTLQRVQASWAGATIAAGAACWTLGNALLAAGFAIPALLPWWIAFLALTIAGERLELARYLSPSRADRASFAAACAAVIAGAALALVDAAAGARLLGAGLAALALWLVLRDMARRSIRREGLTRFSGVCLLSGYVWLGVAGALGLVAGALSAGPLYDAWLHAFFLGFVMAMIFGHAPIIFPTLLARPIPFRSGFYAHLALLHASLAVRVAGDLLGLPEAVRWGGVGNVLAILLFFASTLASLLRAQRARARA